MDGTALIDPFESDFILDIPVRIDWGVVGLTAESTPELFMQDLDNALYRMLPSPGRYIQKWYYSDGIRLDVRTDPVNDLMITPYFEDMSAPYTQDIRQGFIYSGTPSNSRANTLTKMASSTVYMSPLKLNSPWKLHV